MNPAQRRTWWIFGICAAAVAGAMAWITALVCSLEHAESGAQANAEHQTSLRLAMWRMDTWLAPQLAREAARPYFEYRSYYPQPNAYTNLLAEIRPGEVLTPSPLLTYRSELFPLHFQYDGNGEWTSPQVPTGNWRDLAESTTEGRNHFAASAELLEKIGEVALAPLLDARMADAEQELAANCNAMPLQPDPSETLLQNDYQQRAVTTNFAKGVAPNPSPVTDQPATHGPLLPIWLDAPDGASAYLAFVRRVQVGGRSLFQGILADWPQLRGELLAQITDLFPAASLEREAPPGLDAEGQLLATVPAHLVAPAATPQPPGWSPGRTVLAAAWLSVALAVLAVGFTLRSTMSLGERRARFASAVTHELRTPLTTFRMYSEMLADDMVDPGKRATYLATLKSEADRLSRLVENVLCYSRLEEGRYRGRRERLGADQLVERVAPLLTQRTADAGMVLALPGSPVSTQVDVDVDAVTQILFNLVDNACKYAADSTVALEASNSGGQVTLTVRDGGPGVPAEHRAAIFSPFERGARAAGDSVTPGVGLGLALARGLARDLGGELELVETPDGACFALRLPVVGTT